jgi:hypothetical protein
MGARLEHGKPNILPIPCFAKGGVFAVRLRLFCVLVLAATVSAATPVLCTTALADKRVALVIGNSAYKKVPRLSNPVNDARAV